MITMKDNKTQSAPVIKMHFPSQDNKNSAVFVHCCKLLLSQPGDIAR